MIAGFAFSAGGHRSSLRAYFFSPTPGFMWPPLGRLLHSRICHPKGVDSLLEGPEFWWRWPLIIFWTATPSNISLEHFLNIAYFPLLVSTGIYHCRTYFHFFRGVLTKWKTAFCFEQLHQEREPTLEPGDGCRASQDAMAGTPEGYKTIASNPLLKEGLGERGATGTELGDDASRIFTG